MANRWCDGFGRYGGTIANMLNGSSGQAWAEAVTAQNVALSNANPRTGNWHLRIPCNTAGTGLARRVFGAPLTEVYLGRAIYVASLPTIDPQGDTRKGVFLFSLRDQSNNHQVSLWLGTDGALELRRGSVASGDSVEIARSLPCIGAGAYQHIEIYALAGDDADGAFEVRVDEVTKLNLTGITTVDSANVEFSQDAVGHIGNVGLDMDVADCFCNDAVDDGSGCSSWLGDCKSGVVMVDADTAQADFALSAGVSGYTLLNGTPPNDATYLSTSSATAESDFGLANGPANMTEILTTRPFIRAMKDDAGTCTVAPNMKSGTTKGTVAAQPITTAFSYYDSNVPIDPVTGVPWVPSGFNAAKHVVERTA